jgi:hypothetical protein
MFALLLMFLATALAGLMTPVLLISMNGTRADQRRVAEIAAAQAGVDVAIAQIRAADDNTGPNSTNGLTVGVLSKLPCSLTGAVSAAGNSRYSVTIQYYTSDPRGQNTTWLSTNKIQCIQSAGARTAPAFALLLSQGTDQATGDFSTVQTRTVQGTYDFQTTNANIAGGLMHAYNSGNIDLCMDAGSSSPSAGTSVTMQPCTAGKAQQTWAYGQYLTISLVSTQVGGSAGMCIDGGASPEAVNTVVRVQPCGQTIKPQQQWSLNDSAALQGTDNGTSLNSFCLNEKTPDVKGGLLIVGTACGGGAGSYSSTDNWQPDASVGAGAAGASTGQLVNFSEFGRCLDVTNQSTSSTYMIIWPCKQQPDPTKISWNQRWTLPTTSPDSTQGITGVGRITVNPSNTLYCLQSPLSVATGTTGPYVYVVSSTACTSGPLPNNMKWTVYGKTSSYATSYEITDSSGNCLQPTDPKATPPDFFTSGSDISKSIVAKCNGSTLQKWNAPPNILDASPLKNVGECIATGCVPPPPK